MSRRTLLRLALGTIVVAALAVVAHGALDRPPTASAAATPEPAPRPNATVVTQSAQFGSIVAWAPDGEVLYYNDSHTKYYDVDPVANRTWTVEYAAVDTIHWAGPTCRQPPCTRNVIERANLSTGEVTEVYARYDDAEWGAEWHDHVRLDDSRLLIADIVDDQVVVVNTTSGIVEWRWDAQSDFPVESGGPYPRDWAHVNDVSLLPDGRVMVSLRNHDQVVFVDPETGVDEDWTLGREGAHDVLERQHNPDYIPAERGGPAVLASDSENGRLVEYERANGSWERTWRWRDDRMAWPRDADRLPSGNTLAVDTHGNRLVEVAPNGSVVWSVRVPHPYDVERLGTGDESAGGESAARLGLASRRPPTEYSDPQPIEALARPFEGLVPSGLVNPLIYLTPVWVGRQELLAAAVAGVAATTWLVAEAWWRLPLVARSPFARRDR